jgi:hypothetical protein
MTHEMTHCDMCGTKIENGKCICGKWLSGEEHENNPYKLALEKFHDEKRMMLTSDAPHLGVAVVFFRGDYSDCLEITEFIKRKKFRPHYGEI